MARSAKKAVAKKKAPAKKAAAKRAIAKPAASARLDDLEAVVADLIVVHARLAALVRAQFSTMPQSARDEATALLNAIGEV